MQPRRIRVALACLVLLGATPAAAQPTTLRIATGQFPPFVVLQGGQPAGFSVDLWTELARRLGANVVITDLGRGSNEAQLQAVRNGESTANGSRRRSDAARRGRGWMLIDRLDAG